MKHILGSDIRIEPRVMTKGDYHFCSSICYRYSSTPKGEFNMFKGHVDCQFKVKGSLGEAIVNVVGSRTAAKDVWNLTKLIVKPLQSDQEPVVYASL
ncbi:hypothetical protein HK100_012925 [Physocladia obscura]|uniref:Uncharacterized protein n=1 Tax=Physocladia obscura TaxID=109957 RepID=A0AAD5XKG0_9FUNG|nr:hypothetical protein HK100_012925 [Physocladia obscura]